MSDVQAANVLYAYLDDNNGDLPYDPNELVVYSSHKRGLITLNYSQAENVISTYLKNVSSQIKSNQPRQHHRKYSKSSSSNASDSDHRLDSSDTPDRVKYTKRKHIMINKSNYQQPSRQLTQSRRSYSNQDDTSNSDSEHTDDGTTSFDDEEDSESSSTDIIYESMKQKDKKSQYSSVKQPRKHKPRQRRRKNESNRVGYKKKVAS